MKSHVIFAVLSIATAALATSCGGRQTAPSSTMASSESSSVTMVMLDGVAPNDINPDGCDQLGLSGGLQCRVKEDILKWTNRVKAVSGVTALYCTRVIMHPMLAITATMVAGTTEALGFIVGELPCKESFSPEEVKKIEEIVKKQLPPEAVQQSLNIPSKPRK